MERKGGAGEGERGRGREREDERDKRGIKLCRAGSIPLI